MDIQHRIKKFNTRFKNDFGGNFSIMWGLLASTALLTTGAMYDLTLHSNARVLAQKAADNMALSASIAIELQSEDRYKDGKWYSYEEINGGNGDFTHSIKGKVDYDVPDPDIEGNYLARVTVTGSYDTAFSKVIGKSKLSFSAVSEVTYKSNQTTPASLFFVTDNSGSMGWTDSSGSVKLTNLKQSMNSFMTSLDAIDTRGKKVFRTALYPYNSNLINNRKIDPNWGTIKSSKIGAMIAKGGTNPTSALKKVSVKFELESKVHERENKEKHPLKFLVFMTDGANNGDYVVETCKVKPYWWRYSRRRGYQKTMSRPKRSWSWTYVPGQNCSTTLYTPVNDASLVQCTKMKDAGVEIHSIAYDIADKNNTPWNEKTVATEFMKACSSNPETHYKYAETGTDLQEIFDEIGESVMNEVIRIKS